jgi:FMN phosphatase YigB (HAD superfamily)
VHIGDSLIHDVTGALRVGIHSVWLKRKGGSIKDLAPQGLTRVQAVTPDYEITSLSALPTCLVHLMEHTR